MSTPILRVRDAQGNYIPIPAIQGEAGPPGQKGDTGPKGDKGDKGDTGAAGPNLINPDTLTPMVGLLMGLGGKVKTALSGVDYMSPSAITLTPTTITFFDGNITENALLIKLGTTTFLYYGGGVLAVTLANNHFIDSGSNFMNPPAGYRFIPGQNLPAFYMSESGAITSTIIFSVYDSADTCFIVSNYMDPKTNGSYYMAAFLIQLEESL